MAVPCRAAKSNVDLHFLSSRRVRVDKSSSVFRHGPYRVIAFRTVVTFVPRLSWHANHKRKNMRPGCTVLSMLLAGPTVGVGPLIITALTGAAKAYCKANRRVALGGRASLQRSCLFCSPIFKHVLACQLGGTPLDFTKSSSLRQHQSLPMHTSARLYSSAWLVTLYKQVNINGGGS